MMTHSMTSSYPTITLATSCLTRVKSLWNPSTCCSIAALIWFVSVRLLRSFGLCRRLNGLEVVLDQLPALPGNAILVEQILLCGCKVRRRVAVIQFGSFALPGGFNFLSGILTSLAEFDL